MKTAIWMLAAMAGLVAASATDVQAGGPYSNYGPNGYYYSGTYGQFYPPIYVGPRTATGSFVTTAPGRSQYQYNNNYNNGSVLQQYGQSNYLPNGAGYGYGYPGYGGGYGGYGGGYGGYGYRSGFRSQANYGYGW